MQAPSDPYQHLPLIFGSIFESSHNQRSIPHTTRMLLAKYQAALVFIHEEAERSHKNESVQSRLKRLKKGILKMIQNKPKKAAREIFNFLSQNQSLNRNFVEAEEE